LTKKEIAKEVAAKYSFDQSLAKRVVQDVLDSIVTALLKQGRIELRNFGVFEVKHRAPRVARNPRTNQQVNVPAKTVVVFHPGKNLADLIGKQAQPTLKQEVQVDRAVTTEVPQIESGSGPAGI